MRRFCGSYLLSLALGSGVAFAQVGKVEPKILTKTSLESRITVIEVAAGFVTGIKLPDTVNSVVVGDPSAFLVEHSEHEPALVFVKPISRKPSETNLLISTVGGRQVTLLLINRGESGSADRTHVDFLLKYEVSSGFIVAPSAFPFALVGETVPLTQCGGGESECSTTLRKTGDGTSVNSFVDGGSPSLRSGASSEPVRRLDQLLETQESAALPILYGRRIGGEPENGDHVRAGVSRVIDGGGQVLVLFSVVNPTSHAILLMPPQVQLAGRAASGKVVHHGKWSSAEQLPVLDFRLNRRRLGPSERADGVVVFERPPYKQSNETLLLQMAEAGAVDLPALAPIGFGVSNEQEEKYGKRK